MFTLKKYATVHSVEEAYELLHKNRNNIVLGGLMWLKMGSAHYHTGIDLSKLGLNTITENEHEIIIGGMSTLRQVETNKILSDFGGGILPKAVKDIVGVQFRNSATIGASVYSKYGFSDLITVLLAYETEIELFHSGVVPLEEFLKNTYHKDILVNIRIKKNHTKATFLCERFTVTDFSMINVAVSQSIDTGKWKIVIGARPSIAKLAIKAAACLSQNPSPEEISKAIEAMTVELNFGSNIKASKEYRIQLAKVLMKRGIQQICI